MTTPVPATASPRRPSPFYSSAQGHYTDRSMTEVRWTWRVWAHRRQGRYAAGETIASGETATEAEARRAIADVKAGLG